MQKSYSDVYQLIAGIRFQNTLRVNSHIFLYHPLRVHMFFTFPNQVLPQTVQTTHLFFPQLTPLSRTGESDLNTVKHHL